MDESSVMYLSGGLILSEGDIRTINFLYPSKNGVPRKLHSYRAGTEVETGAPVINGLFDKNYRVQIPGQQDVAESQGVPHSSAVAEVKEPMVWSRVQDGAYQAITAGLWTCEPNWQEGHACTIRGFACPMPKAGYSLICRAPHDPY